MVSFVLDHLAWFVPIPPAAILIALAILVPGAWLAVLSFLETTFGKILVIFTITALLAGIAGWEFRGYVAARDATEASQVRADAEANALRERAKAAAAVNLAASRRIEEADRINHTLQGKLDDYVKELAGRKAPRCTLGADDVRGLRAITGEQVHPARRAR